MGCCGGFDGEVPIVSFPETIASGVEVRGKGDIVVTPSDELGKKVYTVEIVPFTPPSINATANPIKEVGATVDFEWSVNIVKGRENIVSRSISPEPSPLPDLTAPFTVSKTGLKATERQSVDYHTITVEDAIGTIVTRKLSISFVNKVYQGFSIKDGVNTPLTETDILAFTGTVADNIKSVYGGQKTYNVPALGALQYIYWVYEAGTTPINSAILSGLPFPLVFLPGSIEVTNPHDGSIKTNYVVVRSANKFGTGSLSITIQ